MATVLHLLKGAPDALVTALVQRALDAGDRVEVVFLEGVAPHAVPDGAVVLRVPANLSYPALVEKVFASDQVIAW